MNISEYSVNAMRSGILADFKFLEKWQKHPDVLYARPMVPAGTKVRVESKLGHSAGPWRLCRRRRGLNKAETHCSSLTEGGAGRTSGNAYLSTSVWGGMGRSR